MITSIRLVNFKNFRDETLRVGPFTVIVGANASGKSNIRDAFRFLHGIGRGYTLAEIVGGKYGPGGQSEWGPIRGATNEIVRFGATDPSFPLPSAFALHVKLELAGKKTCYSITVSFNPNSPDGFEVGKEEMKTESAMIYTTQDTLEPELCVQIGEYSQRNLLLSRSQPALTQLPVTNTIGSNLSSVLGGMRFLELSPDRMREPAFPGQAVLGDSGENLPVVLEEICSDPARKDVFTAWLRELTPMDVRDFRFPRDPSGRVHLQILEANERTISAYSASDGTLRFLAMLAVLLGESTKGLYFFEEIDTGIHPARQWLLLELIEKQAAKGDFQVITTTHAPDFLTFVNDITFENMSVVCRLEDSQNAIIRPIAELPNARKLRKAGRGLGGLLTEGWMETALAFTENQDKAEEDGE